MLPTKWVLSIACRQNAVNINPSNTDLYALADQYESPIFSIYCNALNSIHLLLTQEYQKLACIYYKIGIFDIACKHLTQYANQYKTDNHPQSEHILKQELAIIAILCSQIQDPLFISEFIDDHNQIDSNCLKLMKLSLEIPNVPIKLVLFIYNYYFHFISLEALQVPHNAKRTDPHSPKIVLLENYYAKHILEENTFPQTIVVALLRILLTTCQANDKKNDGGVDISLEWENIYQYYKLSPMNAADEGLWHRIVVSHLIVRLLLTMVVRFRKNSYFQSAFLCQLISDANGILVLMKYINQDLKCELEFNELKLDSINMTETIENILKLLYIVCKGHTDRIKNFLILYKASIILSKLDALFPAISNSTLKMYKIMIKYLPKKWKEKNMAIINQIYEKLTVQPSDDWLGNEMLAGVADEDKKNIIDFNNKHYLKKKVTTPIQTIDQWIEEHEKDAQVTEEFKNKYDKWLEEEVIDAL